MVDVILCRGTVRFFINREQIRPFSLNDFYFRLMETTKTEKNKYKIPKRKHSLCDSRNRELAGKWFWRCVSRFALNDAAQKTLLG